MYINTCQHFSLQREGVAGIATAIGMCLHNLPEGVGIYVSCMSGLDVGLPIAIAIVLHVIPEGMAVAAPIYHATNEYASVITLLYISLNA